eukprot:CAMPEP_0173348964 /NCGR_PEP_ID=MMETSP1144-20121109/14041_1 /TAXON_ID=483371 /ORGANISM="non described non described, Strain CCMP2298" /LENGTH=61 /DNA_ID=CAMNT_0014296699 /DNA_START=342 /DNA_END=527 /DNA_ORIENTATION=+
MDCWVGRELLCVGLNPSPSASSIVSGGTLREDTDAPPSTLYELFPGREKGRISPPLLLVLA